jgi:hypothetical protein
VPCVRLSELSEMNLCLGCAISFVVDKHYARRFDEYDLPHAYVRRKERSHDGVVDYDLDNEDLAWLEELQTNCQV